MGVGGPVGSGKTALMDALCKRLRDRYEIAAITNDIYTKWDAEYLVRSGALKPERIAGVETGGCPHAAIREDASPIRGYRRLRQKLAGAGLIFVASGRRYLSACSPGAGGLMDLRDRRGRRRQDSAKGGPGITRSDLLVINKIDLAPYVGASSK